MPLDQILARLHTLLPELVAAENFLLARSVREVITLIESEQKAPSPSRDAA